MFHRNNQNEILKDIKGKSKEVFLSLPNKRGSLYQFGTSKMAYLYSEITTKTIFEPMTMVPIESGTVVLCLGRELAKEASVEWPYWIFLNDGKICFLYADTKTVKNLKEVSK